MMVITKTMNWFRSMCGLPEEAKGSNQGQERQLGQKLVIKTSPAHQTPMDSRVQLSNPVSELAKSRELRPEVTSLDRKGKGLESSSRDFCWLPWQ